MHPAAREALLAAISEGWADPARLHHAGRRAALLLDAARGSIATSLGVQPDEVHFTSSLQQAATAFIEGTVAIRSGAIAVSAIEAQSMLDAVSRHPHRILNVDSAGHVDLAPLQRADELAMLAVQIGNSEVGTMQALDDVVAAAPGVPLLTDASQAVGRVPLPEVWTMLVCAARDWAGPAGVAIAVARRSHRWSRPVDSGRGWLSGFPDIPGAVAAATALEHVRVDQEAEAARAFDLVERLRHRLASVPDVELPGDPKRRLPHVLTASVLYVDGEALVTELDRRGFAVASGSACVADGERPSHVLAAMGALTGGNVRVSLPFGCTQETIDAFAEAFADVVMELRGRYL
jgi:cysteine desulfurase